MELHTRKVAQFHRVILHWYRSHKRSLPWRTTSDPYKILVSEIMLQQTQVSRVKQKYPSFLRKFSTLSQLARATRASVIRAWQGMGYNNRALRLQSLAKTIVRDYRGKIPSDIDRLLRLPGVGRYTAHALACFAFQKSVPIVDVNIHRLLSRVFWKMQPTTVYKDGKAVWHLAQYVLPRRGATDWNQALMDFGATVCTARKPLCDQCPLTAMCSSYPVSTYTPNARRSTVSKEPTRDGLPIRIYRGRIVEQLRRLNGRSSISVSTLGKLIKEPFLHKDMMWLEEVLQKLHREGLVHVERRGNVLFARLPLS